MADESTSLIYGKKSRPSFYNDNIQSTDYCTTAVKLLVDDTEERTWAGLTSRELLEFSDDPFWVRARFICFVAACFTFVTLLSSVLVLTVRAPRCQGLDWWQQGPMYHVMPSCFRDSDMSGRGDLTGIESKLDYIVDLGVKSVWLSPIYKSPMKDFGYDIQDFKDVDKIFGSLDDFKRLVQAMKQRGLKLVMDFVPNHSSNEHEWFNKSAAREAPYTDYYVWAPARSHDQGGKPTPPNNWLSVFGGSAWEWNDQRQEFYLHQFAKEQPDLNFRNRAVIDEMLSVLRFWLDLGVNGFRVDSMPHLFEDSQLRDEPASGDPTSSPGEYNSLKHIRTQNLPEVMPVLAEFRQLLTEYAQNTDGEKRLLMVEVYASIDQTMKYYGDKTTALADFPFNFSLMTSLVKNSTASDVKKTIDTWYQNVPQGKWTNWVLGNHDQSRIATRFGSQLVDGLHMISLLLPGTAVTYYGEEIGMEDTSISWADTVDPAGRNAGPDNYTRFTRDPSRTPMQWNDGKNAGFSEADKTWLPVNADYKTVNVEAQTRAHGDTHISIYKALVRARNEPAIMHGQLDTRVINTMVFAFTRIQPERLGYAVAVNWGNESQKVDLTQFEGVSAKAQVYTKSINFAAGDLKYVNTQEVPLGPKEGIVIMFRPENTQPQKKQ